MRRHQRTEPGREGEEGGGDKVNEEKLSWTSCQGHSHLQRNQRSKLKEEIIDFLFAMKLVGSDLCLMELVAGQDPPRQLSRRCLQFPTKLLLSRLKSSFVQMRSMIGAGTWWKVTELEVVIADLGEHQLRVGRLAAVGREKHLEKLDQ